MASSWFSLYSTIAHYIYSARIYCCSYDYHILGSLTAFSKTSDVYQDISLLPLSSLVVILSINHLTPNDHYRGRTAPLTSKRYILYIYSTNKILNILNMVYTLSDRLCGLVVRVSGYRYRGPGFDPRRYQIF